MDAIAAIQAFFAGMILNNLHRKDRQEFETLLYRVMREQREVTSIKKEYENRRKEDDVLLHSLRKIKDSKSVFWMAGVLLAFGRSGSLKFYQGESISLPGDVEAMFLLARTLIYTFVFVGIFAGTEAILENRTFRKSFLRKTDRKAAAGGADTSPWDWAGSQFSL